MEDTPCQKDGVMGAETARDLQQYNYNYKVTEIENIHGITAMDDSLTLLCPFSLLETQDSIFVLRDQENLAVTQMTITNPHIDIGKARVRHSVADQRGGGRGRAGWGWGPERKGEREGERKKPGLYSSARSQGQKLFIISGRKS